MIGFFCSDGAVLIFKVLVFRLEFLASKYLRKQKRKYEQSNYISESVELSKAMKNSKIKQTRVASPTTAPKT